MCVAMMVPAALPAVRHVAANSLRWRRQRAVAQFLIAYTAVWTVFGLAALPAVALLTGPLPAGSVFVGTLVVAASWQVLPYQRRFLRDCHRTVPLPPRGWRATAACARFGLRQGCACAGVCGPLMLAMASVTREPVMWMVLLSAASTVPRLLPAGPRLRERMALGLALLTLIALLSAGSAGSPT